MVAAAEKIQHPESLYEKDFHAWIQHQTDLLRDGRLSELDQQNLLEEIEAMGRSERHALESNLIVVLLHLLKFQHQPTCRSNSWRASIREHRRRIRRALSDSPSLNPFLQRIYPGAYRDARALAADETGLPNALFPTILPYTLEQVLDPDFLPDDPA